MGFSTVLRAQLSFSPGVRVPESKDFTFRAAYTQTNIPGAASNSFSAFD
jgi:hypothetical protein